jgi:DnaJ-class molecular chaperone
MKHFSLLNSWILLLQANAQEKFLRIKHAYNTLLNSESRSKYANSNSDSSWASSSRESKSTAAEEQFYGFGTEIIYSSSAVLNCLPLSNVCANQLIMIAH